MPWYDRTEESVSAVKILVFSDSHGRVGPMQRAIDAEVPDLVCHLGDCERDCRQLVWDGPLCQVCGNCDLAPAQPGVYSAAYAGYRFFMTHGHLYGVKYGLLRLSLAAQEAGADVVLFGHTHVPYCSCEGGRWFLNPGSCGQSALPTYGIIEITDGALACRIAAAPGE